MTQASPLQLKAYRLQKLVIEFNDQWLSTEDSEPDSPDAYRLEADFDLYEGREPDTYLTMLLIECRPKAADTPRRFNEVSIITWGIFSLDPNTDEDLKNRLIPYNCLAILHGIARGVLTSATGACGGGPFLLPVLNYVEMVERKMQEQTNETAQGVEDEE